MASFSIFCFVCMGVSAAGLSEEAYTKITHGYTLALAKELVVKNPNMMCTYVSGAGTDSSEKGRSMWARVKGRTENELLRLGFRKAYMYRPGAIIPKRGIKSGTKLYQFVYDYFMWFILLVKAIAPNSVVDTQQIGRSMINLLFEDSNVKILNPKEIIETA